MDPFVCVTKYKGQAVVDVRIGQNHLRYPLTKAGCLAAGRDLFKAGAESWMNSSSVDFPQDVKKSFRGDVRELMSEGFNAELVKQQAPRKAMVEKALAFLLKSDEFLTSLDDDEFKAWQKMYDDFQKKGE